MIKHSKPWITDADQDAVDHQLKTGMIAGLDKLKEFEDAVAQRMHATGSVVTPSGTAALVLCLKTLGVGADKDDEVILPSYVCPSVMQAVVTAGAKPVLCDVGKFWNATEDTFAAHFGPRTKAIVAVNMFGISARLASLKKYPYSIVEDHCMSFGLPDPLFGDAAICSFYATKCLTTGEGGAAVFQQKHLLSRAAELRRNNAVPGTLTDLQAALGLSQLARYDQMLARRRDIASRYLKELPEHLTHRVSKVRDRSIFYRFPLCMDGDYDSIAARFAERGVTVGRAVALMLHRLTGRSDDDFPNTVTLFNSTVSIPIYPAMSDEDVGKVIDAVKSVARGS
jgi:perosamine synthetase